MASRALLCLFGFVAFSTSSRLHGICDFEAPEELCDLIGDGSFEQRSGRPSWNLNAMDSGYSSTGYLLLTSYNFVKKLTIPQLTATKGDEEVTFAFFLNGEGEDEAFIHLYLHVGDSEQLLWQAKTHRHKWKLVNLPLNVAVGEQFQLVFKAKAHRNILSRQHTWLGLDYISITNEGGAGKCFRPPPVQYANPWVCSDGQYSTRPSPREELADGTTCITSCQRDFIQQGEPLLTCEDGEWLENGDVVFMCIDTMPPEFDNCPTDIQVTTPFGWGTVWYTFTPPQITDNTGAWALELYLNEELQVDTTMTSAIAPGTYSVRYTVRDFNYNENVCNYTITVVAGDQNPPQLLTCPSSFSVESSTPVAPGWSDPIFLDDSGYIAKVESNYSPNDLMAWGAHDVIYTAYDNSSNAATCSFSVTVKGVPCKPLALPVLGALVCHDSFSGRFCVSMCGPEGDFDLLSDELHVPSDYLCSTSGSWYPYEFIYNCLAEYGSTPIMSSEYYFSGSCDETNTQDAMKSQALTIFNLADTDISLGQDLTPEDFYVTCGPTVKMPEKVYPNVVF